MKTLALCIIAACYLVNTIAVYQAEDSGTNVFVGNFGYHFENKDSAQWSVTY